MQINNKLINNFLFNFFVNLYGCYLKVLIPTIMSFQTVDQFENSKF